MKFFRSLLAKYMLIIVLAISIVQISYLGVATFMLGISKTGSGDFSSEALLESDIEEQWHTQAKSINNASEATIEQLFQKWQKQYPTASMFWVSEKGNLLTTMNVQDELPKIWTPAFTTKFIKERYGSDPFTVIAFLGDDVSNGFIVLEISRDVFKPPLIKIYDNYGSFLFFGVVAVILFFIAVSFLFFKGIRKRLLHLQEAMEIRDVDGLPIEIQVKKRDEIGQLEHSFNRMVCELRDSKQRQQKEEQLRRELIANLSHDLRTPLTKVRAQSYTISKEALSEEGIQALKAMEASIVNIDALIENLMSYTLLMASKYKFEPKNINVIRFVREHLTTWYPVFEREGFTIDIELQAFESNEWSVDPLWLGRIFDNIFQNVLRHAYSGKYISVKTKSTDSYKAFIIEDHGQGMKNESNAKGAGIGLSIVDIMVKGMDLEWEITSSQSGTKIIIKNVMQSAKLGK
ncbi:HAMP domain-containing sensor histidine kinase [Lysinibacillus irui]|uniref:histidine kinase n=1 Tax=Lysinibacillus irui TaxID=2998077 RepID=A0ABU5NR09_9BACI|nr:MULTISPECIES: HAMP domain-containing sensor histidine kinase [Lysinibacillus]MEA0552514.1 HAMP domain-containing sensor histidine kinase [Lysinibacillus irui]MEA0562892.1 HAMP domain-containing sensor histidine kinase [Lysinibacillus irui]MEA0978466.1 HAMP domain-containing sensor histidine kinase [Lysinibacillus irui]MEA1044620.1 HAMP domain-containing sensor histidine kinase [Lysinibacillus irui]